MYWWFWANVSLPFGVVVLLVMTLPLHTHWLRKPVQSLVGAALEVPFLNMKAFDEPVTVFHVIMFFSVLNFVAQANPLYKHGYEHQDIENLAFKIGRWRRERNLYISAFNFVTYFMIYSYHELRRKYDMLKARVNALETPKKTETLKTTENPGKKYSNLKGSVRISEKPVKVD